MKEGSIFMALLLFAGNIMPAGMRRIPTVKNNMSECTFTPIKSSSVAVSLSNPTPEAELDTGFDPELVDLGLRLDGCSSHPSRPSSFADYCEGKLRELHPAWLVKDISFEGIATCRKVPSESDGATLAVIPTGDYKKISYLPSAEGKATLVILTNEIFGDGGAYFISRKTVGYALVRVYTYEESNGTRFRLKSDSGYYYFFAVKGASGDVFYKRPSRLDRGESVHCSAGKIKREAFYGTAQNKRNTRRRS